MNNDGYDNVPCNSLRVALLVRKPPEFFLISEA